jgi:hypothetical protein
MNVISDLDKDKIGTVCASMRSNNPPPSRPKNAKLLLTACSIAKKNQSLDFDSELNGVGMGRTLHSNVGVPHVSNIMKNLISSRIIRDMKFAVLNDECTTLNQTSFIVCVTGHK